MSQGATAKSSSDYEVIDVTSPEVKLVPPRRTAGSSVTVPLSSPERAGSGGQTRQQAQQQQQGELQQQPKTAIDEAVILDFFANDGEVLPTLSAIASGRVDSKPSDRPTPTSSDATGPASAAEAKEAESRTDKRRPPATETMEQRPSLPNNRKHDHSKDEELHMSPAPLSQRLLEGTTQQQQTTSKRPQREQPRTAVLTAARKEAPRDPVPGDGSLTHAVAKETTSRAGAPGQHDEEQFRRRVDAAVQEEMLHVRRQLEREYRERETARNRYWDMLVAEHEAKMEEMALREIELGQLERELRERLASLPAPKTHAQELGHVGGETAYAAALDRALFPFLYDNKREISPTEGSGGWHGGTPGGLNTTRAVAPALPRYQPRVWDGSRPKSVNRFRDIPLNDQLQSAVAYEASRGNT